MLRLPIPRVVVRDTALSYGSSVLAGGAQFVTLVVLARALTKADVGIVVLTTAISGTIATAAELGVGPLIATNYQRLRHENPGVWAGLVRFVARMTISVAATVLALGVVSAIVLRLLGQADVAHAVGFGLATGALSVVLGYVQTFLMARKLFGQAALASVLPAVMRLLAVVALAAVGSLSVLSVLVAYLLSVAVTVGLISPSLPRPLFPPAPTPQASGEARRLAVSVMRWVVVSRAAAVVSGRLDVFLLSALSTSSAVATYAVAYQPATPLVMFGNAAGQVALPHLGDVVSGERARRIVLRWAKLFALVLLAAFGAAILGYTLLPTVFGSAYSDARSVFVVLIFAFAMQAWMLPMASLLYALGRSRDVAVLSLVYMIAAIVLESGLIVGLGAIGAALGVLIASFLAAAMALRLVWRAASRVNGGLSQAHGERSCPGS